MSTRIVILGAGTGGTIMANRLHRALGPDRAEITVVDRDDQHIYQPGLLFVPFGMARAEDLARPRRAQIHDEIVCVTAGIDRVDIESRQVFLIDGPTLSYDILIVASGSDLVPQETPGLTDEGWMERIFTFYDLAGASALEGALSSFEGGRIVVNIIDMPIKCPVAPLEFCFLADSYFDKHGLRDKVDITFVTPLDGAFTKPVAKEVLDGLLEAKGVKLVSEFNTGEVDGVSGRIVSYDGREVEFDLLVTVPLHGGSDYVERSTGLGDALGFIPTDPHTLQSLVRPEIFVIGDASDLPSSKAGSVAHFQAEILTSNIVSYLADEPLDASFDGHSNCFIETGGNKALLIDFNYETEPLPGRFPFAFSPIPLLVESYMNHVGKLLFKWVYRHLLLPGRDLPFIGPAMPQSGKIARG